MKSTALEELYSVSEAAKTLNVSEETVRRYIRQGKLVARKVRQVGLRRAWSISAAELARFRDEGD